MQKLTALIAAPLLAIALVATPGLAQTRDDQQTARAEMQAGRNMSIRDIERRIIPRMEEGDDYIGWEYDSTAQAYRLKFIRNGRMIWVDVDAQTARILRISR